MRPFRALMKWMDDYTPGNTSQNVPSDTDVVEFRKLAQTIQKAVDRFEYEYEERKIFIGNASHELQTPLAVCSNRLDMLLDRDDLSEDMAVELMKLRQSLQHLIRLNKTLLLLSRIENNQFPEVSDVNMNALLRDAVGLNDEIYSHKSLSAAVFEDGDFVCSINEQMASVLVGNLVKNAYIHSAPGAGINVKVSGNGFSVANTGDAPLDEKHLFRRFYQSGGRREGSTGLGLALAYSVCERSGLMLKYEFSENHHIFSVNLKK